MLVLGYAVAFNIRKLKSDFGVMTRAFRMPVLLARRAGNSIATKRRARCVRDDRIASGSGDGGGHQIRGYFTIHKSGKIVLLCRVMPRNPAKRGANPRCRQ